jgi:hypothetical protein
MTGHLGSRTSKEMWDLIHEHFERGVLRQGWGHVNLGEIGRLVDSGEADEEQVKTRRYTKSMLEISRGALW